MPPLWLAFASGDWKGRGSWSDIATHVSCHRGTAEHHLCVGTHGRSQCHQEDLTERFLSTSAPDLEIFSISYSQISSVNDLRPRRGDDRNPATFEIKIPWNERQDWWAVKERGNSSSPDRFWNQRLSFLFFWGGHFLLQHTGGEPEEWKLFTAQIIVNSLSVPPDSSGLSCLYLFVLLDANLEDLRSQRKWHHSFSDVHQFHWCCWQERNLHCDLGEGLWHGLHGLCLP